MKWEESRQSDYVEDRRGSGQYAGGGGSSGHLGLGAMIVLGLIGYAFGIDPRLLIGGAEMVSKVTSKPQQAAPAGQVGAPKDQMGRFVAAVLSSETKARPCRARPYPAPWRRSPAGPQARSRRP